MVPVGSDLIKSRPTGHVRLSAAPTTRCIPTPVLAYDGALSRLLGDRYFPSGWPSDRARSGPTDPLTAEVSRHSPCRWRAEAPWTAFFLDCKDPLLKRWLSKPQTTRNFGSRYDPARTELYTMQVRISTMYRGLVFLKSVTPSIPLPN